MSMQLQLYFHCTIQFLDKRKRKTGENERNGVHVASMDAIANGPHCDPTIYLQKGQFQRNCRSGSYDNYV